MASRDKGADMWNQVQAANWLKWNESRQRRVSERNPWATHGTSGDSSSSDAPPPKPEAVASAADSSSWTPPPLPKYGLPPPAGPPSCFRCHTEYRSRSRYCMICCNELPLPPEPPCIRCKTPLPLEANFCSNCAQPTNQSTIAGFSLQG